MSAPDPTSHADWTKSGGAQPNDSGPPVIPPLQDLVPGHMPGEFPTDEPIASHKLDIDPSTVGGAGGAAYSTAGQGQTDAGSYGRPEASGSALPTRSKEDESHLGRNTAIAGGATAAAGAAGYGAYELSKDSKPSEVNQAPTQPGWVSEKYSENKNVTGTVPTHPEPTSHPGDAALGKAGVGEETHHGRDAAIGGAAVAGTGAAGYGAYELSKDKDDTKLHETSKTDKQPGWIDEKKSEQKQSEEESHKGRDAAIAGGATAAAGAAGYGAYEMSKDDEKAQKEAQKEAEKAEKERQKEMEKQEKERQKEAEKQQKEHEKAEKERQKEAEKKEKERQKEAEKQEKERQKEAEKQQKEREKEEKERQKEAEKREKEEKKAAEKREKEREKEEEKHDKEKQAALYEEEKRRREQFEKDEAAKKGEEETHYGRDAAIAGGATAATGAAGYGAYEARKGATSTTHEPVHHDAPGSHMSDPVGHHADPSAPDAYQRSGKGLIATDGELDNKFETYDVGSDKNPEQTAMLKEQIRQIEHEKAEMYPEKVGQVEKPSLIQKILHPNKSKEQQREYEESHLQGQDKALSEREAAHGSPGNAAAAGTAAGTAGTATGGTSHSTGLPVGDDGMIHIQHEGAHPDAPHMVVKEAPGGGIQTSEK